jgi:hypothetical protein
MVTGQKYRIHWGEGIDFERMSVDISSSPWQSTDKNIYIFHNFTDVRARVAFNMNGNPKDVVENATLITKTSSQWVTGDNVVYNESVREIHYVLNGKNL